MKVIIEYMALTRKALIAITAKSHSVPNLYSKKVPNENRLSILMLKWMTELCKNEPTTAHRMYYDYSKTEADTLMDAIIDNTLGRLLTPIKPDADKWQELREMLAEIDIVTLTDEQYQSLWAL